MALRRVLSPISLTFLQHILNFDVGSAAWRAIGIPFGIYDVEQVESEALRLLDMQPMLSEEQLTAHSVKLVLLWPHIHASLMDAVLS